MIDHAVNHGQSNHNRKYTFAPSDGAVTELVIIPYLNLFVLTDKMRFYINVNNMLNLKGNKK